MRSRSPLSSLVLDLLTTLRLTRLVTTDKLGDELIVQPAQRWADSREPVTPQWRSKLVSGLECPFCVGFWIGLAVLVLPIPRILKKALALNYVMAHISRRLD